MTKTQPGPDTSMRKQVRDLLTELEGVTADLNETETRVRIIDRILEAVGWPHADIAREPGSGTGDFLDYVLQPAGKPWMIVEAKRAGEDFHIMPLPPKGARRNSHLVEGLMQRGSVQAEAVFKQAARYCNDRGIALACVTNGLQWIFFRGISVGRPWKKGPTVAFESPAEVDAQFDLFCSCLARESAGEPWLLELVRQDSMSIFTSFAATVPSAKLPMVSRSFGPRRSSRPWWSTSLPICSRASSGSALNSLILQRIPRIPFANASQPWRPCCAMPCSAIKPMEIQQERHCGSPRAKGP